MKNISIKILFFLLIPSIANSHSFYAYSYKVLTLFHTVTRGSRGLSAWQREEALKLVDRTCLVVGRQAEKDDEMLFYLKQDLKQSDPAFLQDLLKKEEKVLSAHEKMVEDFSDSCI